MKKGTTILVASMLFLFLGWRSATAIMIAEVTLAPSATPGQVLARAVHPPYQIAAPHRGLLKQIHWTLVPAASACGTRTCDGNESQQGCQAGCPYTCGMCPNCNTGPCVIYTCVFVGGNKL